MYTEADDVAYSVYDDGEWQSGPPSSGTFSEDCDFPS